MIYVKYMPFHSIRYASRNKREILVPLELGYDITIFSNDKNIEGIELPSEVNMVNDGSLVLTYSIKKVIRIFLVLRNQIVVFIKTLLLQGDVFSCHDLGALRFAYLATRFRKSPPQLIYDSHEYELYRNIKRNKLQKLFVKKWEQFLIKKCAFTIMTNETVAEELANIYKLSNKPIVIRSTPEKWIIDETECQKTREIILNSFN